MPIKRPTSGKQVAVQRAFHLSRSSFFYLSALMERTQSSALYILACILHTAALNTDLDSWSPEVKPRPKKPGFAENPGSLNANCNPPMHGVIVCVFSVAYRY